MASTPNSVSAVKVGPAVVFFLLLKRILVIFVPSAGGSNVIVPKVCLLLRLVYGGVKGYIEGTGLY